MPAPLRNLAAGLRGWQLSQRRYGAQTDKWVAEAVDRETWTPDQWRCWQGERLARLLGQASRRVPAYRRLWGAELGYDGGDPFKCLARLPILGKELLRQDSSAFVDAECRIRDLWPEHTSGTTGTPLRLWHSRDTLQAWYALVEARWRGWYGFNRETRWAILGGQLIVSPKRDCPPYWVYNSPMRQLYLSAYHLSERSAADYLKALQDHGARYLLGYASSMAILAREAGKLGMRVPSLSAVISNAEPLYDHQRETIRTAFGCPVYDSYGMSEMVCGASECHHGQLHLWPDAGIHEVLAMDSDEPVQPGQTGRLVCTGLLNFEMPLIRYATGDSVAVSNNSERCPCGRTLPVLARIEGRLDDVIVTPMGRHVGRLDPVFKGDMDIVEAQIVQCTPRAVEVRVVRGARYTPITESRVRHALVERLDGMDVSFAYVDSIPRGRNGKFKAVLSLVRESGRFPLERVGDR